MSYLNKILLIGNAGQEPEIRTFPDGNKIAIFSLATSKSFKQDNGEYKTTTQWHRIVVKNKNLITYLIEKEYVKKGIKLYLEGELATREFDKDGNTSKITEIIVNMNHTIQLLTAKEKEENDTITDDEMAF